MSGPFFFPEIAGIKSCANFRSANCGLKSLASQHRLKVLTIGWPVVALTSRGQESGSPNTQLNATLRNNFSGQRQRPETVPAIQSADCRDKMRARIAASSGLFALNREISVCAGLRGGAGRTRTSNQTVIGETRV